MENLTGNPTVWDRALKILAAAGGAIAGLFGGFDAVLIVLVAFMAVDYLSGLIVAWMGKSQKTEGGGLDSKVGAKGIAKKGLMLLIVLVAALLDRAIGADQAVFRNAVIWFYIANEGLSILENMALAGLDVPKLLHASMEQIKKKNDEPPDGGLEA